MQLLRRSLFAAVVCVVAVAGVASAQGAGENDARVDGLIALQSEILLLVELDAFESVPPTLAAVHREWVSHTNGFTRDSLLRWLYDVDAEGAVLLERLVAEDIRPNRALRTALGTIPNADRVLLEGGSTISLAASDYIGALQILRTDLPVGANALAGPRTSASAPPDAAQDLGDSPAPTEDGVAGGSDYPWLAVTLTLLAVLIAGLVMIAIGRRRTAPSMVAGAFDRLLDAGRRMAGALDPHEIAAIAVDEAVALANADVGAFVHVRTGRLSLAHQTGDFIDDHSLEGGALDRVAATGRSLRLVTDDEPAVSSLPAAVLVVPVMGEGSVIGVLVLGRSNASPFTDADEALIGRLAPMVGSATAAAKTHDSVATLSRTDSLTGLGNRRSLDNDLAAALMALSDGRYLGLVMVDVDHFKRFNDQHGHAAGDQALKAVGSVIAAQVRFGDAAYRYGGEEFAILLRDVSPSHATDVAERIRVAVADLGLPGAESQPGGCLTVSAGVAVVAGGGVDAALAAADRALYEAKEQGRDRVVVAAGIPTV